MSSTRMIETAAGPAVLKRSDRRTLAISVLPDGSLELIAPRDADDAAILSKVAKRSRWIASQRREFHEMNATRGPRRYVSGATHRYLGRQYRLKVCCGQPASVALRGGHFHIATPTGEPDEVRVHLDAWFRRQARDQFARRLEGWQAWCRRHQIPEPQLVLRRMPNRWGSAGRDGRIALNPELIHTPSVCVDYVIAHEICHLRHPLHSPQFFRLLSSLLPDWRARKARLERSEVT